MTAILKHALLVGGLAVAAQATAQVTLYEHPGFRGESFNADHPFGNLERSGFNNRASSAIVRGDSWEVCDGPGFSGRCVVLRPGEYPSLGAMGLNDSVTSVRREADRTARIEPPVAPGPAQVTLYGRENFQGRSITADRPIGDLERVDFNDRASSAIVQGGAWEVCDDARFGGRCVILRPGRYPSLAAMGLDNRVSSLRLAGAAPAPAPGPAPGQITLYGRENFEGRSLTADRPIGDLERVDFNDRASSAVVQGGAWEVCDDARFAGRCVILRPGRYPSLAAMGLDNRVSSLRLAGAAPAPAPGPAPGQITFYGRENFEGRSITVDRPVGDLERMGFSDRASSLVVSGTPWEVCDDVRFNGRCVVLRPGRYPSLAMIGLNDRISSVRATRE
jgi:beta/gamma crystallin